MYVKLVSASSACQMHIAPEFTHELIQCTSFGQDSNWQGTKLGYCHQKSADKNNQQRCELSLEEDLPKMNLVNTPTRNTRVKIIS